MSKRFRNNGMSNGLSKGFGNKIRVHDFVSDFLDIDRGLKISKKDILLGICRHIKENRNYLISMNLFSDTKIPINNFIASDCRLERFFKNCLLIKDSIEPLNRIERYIEKLLIPNFFTTTIEYARILPFLKYCENGIYILNEEDLKNQKIFIEKIRDELLAFVLSPDHIHYWIHLGHGVNLEIFQEH